MALVLVIYILPPRLTPPPFQFPFSLPCLFDTEYGARPRISHRKEVDRLDSFAYISVTKRPDPPHPLTDSRYDPDHSIYDR